MTNVSDVAGQARKLVEDYRNALAYLESCSEPLGVEQLQEAWRISGAGMSEDAIAEQYTKAVRATGEEEASMDMREALTSTLTEGIGTFQKVLAELGE